MVIEHIAAEFAPNLVGWLQGRCVLPVEVAREGQPPMAGRVAVAATDDHLILRSDQRFSWLHMRAGGLSVSAIGAMPSSRSRGGALG